MMLGLLLARSGIDVAVLEKHADFFRDFRGETIHPSTMELLDQLGLIERFFRLRHTKVDAVEVETPSGPVTVADFRRLRTRFPFLVFVPQWDFLELIADCARQYPNFRLIMNAEAVGMTKEDGVVRGIDYVHDNQRRQISAILTVAADGRDSRIRDLAGLVPASVSSPMDVMLFRISRREGDPSTLRLIIRPGHILLLINRFEYWQVAYAIPKGGGEALRDRSIESFRSLMSGLKPDFTDRFLEVLDWSQVKLLSVQSNRLHRWHLPGLLLIGDAAHAMSPLGGVGINLAIQDAVAAANVIWGPLAVERVSDSNLERVQRRRWLPTVVIQAMQRAIDRSVIAPTLAGRETGDRMLFSVLRYAPAVTALTARLVGLGIRRERIAPL